VTRETSITVHNQCTSNCTTVYDENRLELNLSFTIGRTDDGDSGGRNRLLNNNMRMDILIKVHLLVCHKGIKHFNKGARSTKFIAITLYATRFHIQQFYVLPTQCIYVFCVDLRTDCDYFPIQH